MTRFALIVEDDPTLQKARPAISNKWSLRGRRHSSLRCRRGASAVDSPIWSASASSYRHSQVTSCASTFRGPLGLTSVPILVTSHSSFAGEMASAEEAGASAFLKKPFTMGQLTKYVEALLGQVHPSVPYLRRRHRDRARQSSSERNGGTSATLAAHSSSRHPRRASSSASCSRER